MAELEIGQHCSYAECKQLDFLPITCSGCGQVFCKEHSFADNHSCPKAEEEVRPEYDGPKSFPCHSQGCSNRELTQVVCVFCQRVYCLKHRHTVEHDCDKAPQASAEPRMAKTAQHVQNILDSKAQQQQQQPESTKKKMSKKAKATAAKVGLMKLKMKASGSKSIPEAERVYLQVLLPKDSKLRSKPMFFSKLWSVGRVIDVIAQEVGLRNLNDVAGVPRLRLFESQEGEILRTDQALERCITDDIVYSGGDVILEYVEDSLINLKNTHEYKLGK